jgi:hypothetical protein
LDFDTSLFHTKSRGLRRLFFRRPTLKPQGLPVTLPAGKAP